MYYTYATEAVGAGRKSLTPTWKIQISLIYIVPLPKIFLGTPPPPDQDKYPSDPSPPEKKFWIRKLYIKF